MVIYQEEVTDSSPDLGPFVAGIDEIRGRILNIRQKFAQAQSSKSNVDPLEMCGGSIAKSF